MRSTGYGRGMNADIVDDNLNEGTSCPHSPFLVASASLSEFGLSQGQAR